MYQFKVCEPAQHLFHPDNAEALAQARTDMHTRIHAILKAAQFPDELVPLVRNTDMLIDAVLRWGDLPMFIQLNMPVVKDDVDPSLFEAQHPSVQKQFLEEFPYIKDATFYFTREEPWWNGECSFLVSDANSFLMSIRYQLSVRGGEVRDYVKRGRGRPRNDAAHAEREERAGRYKEWIESCPQYKQQLHDKTVELAAAEESARLQTAEIERECAARIAQVQSAVAEQRAALKLLKAQGSPKWIP